MKNYISKISTLLLIATMLPLSLSAATKNKVRREERVNDAHTRACCKTSAKACLPIAITTITTLSVPGHYCLANSLVGTGTLITIISDDVILDLNGHYLEVTSGSALEISSVTGTGLQNIIVENGFITSDQSSTATGVMIANVAFPTDLHAFHFNIIFKNLGIRLCNGAGVVANAIEKLVIDQCSLDSNGQNLYVNNSAEVTLLDSSFRIALFGDSATLFECNRTVMQNCVFTRNQFGGLTLNTCSELYATNCLFNDNGDSGFGNGLDGLLSDNLVFNNCSFSFNFGTGMSLGSTSLLNVFNCTFNENGSTGFGDGFDAIASVPTSLINDFVFEQCTFSSNAAKGFYIEGLPGNCVGFKLSDCQAMNNTDHGFTFSNGATDIVLDNCVASGNTPGNGFVLTTTVGSIATLIECIAKDNTDGFNMVDSLGSGLLRGCSAVGNSAPGSIGFGPSLVGCGFNDRVDSLYQYVSNVAQGNGSNAASSMISTTTDTNYCLDGAATEYTPVTGGPGTQRPFSQYGRSTFTDQFNAGVTSWDNITLE